MKVSCKYCGKTFGEFTVIKGSMKCKRCKIENQFDITTQSEIKRADYKIKVATGGITK